MPARTTRHAVLLQADHPGQGGGSVVETEPLPGGVTFYSDGTCTGFRLQIRLNGGASIIAIDPWTCAPVIPRAPNP